MIIAPSRGLLRDCENRLWNRWSTLQHYTQGGDHPIQRGGKFLWIQKTGESAAARAHVASPVYQNSRVDCYVMFYYVKSGTIG